MTVFEVTAYVVVTIPILYVSGKIQGVERNLNIFSQAYSLQFILSVSLLCIKVYLTSSDFETIPVILKHYIIYILGQAVKSVVFQLDERHANRIQKRELVVGAVRKTPKAGSYA